MRRTSLAALLTGAAVFIAPLAPAGAAPAPKTVGTDDEGDWGANTALAGTPAQALGGPTGQDLVEAQVGMADAKTVNFIIKVSSLPPTGGVPEAVRYVWSVDVDGEYVELDGKFTNYTRGACDPTAGTCPPPRDPGQAPFMVRGNCVDNQAAVTCEEIGLVHGEFDASAGTITVPVSLELLGAKPGAKITNGIQPNSNFSGIWAIPSVFASQADMPKDELLITGTYVVPRK